MDELASRIDSLSDAVAKLGFISSTTHDAGLRLILNCIEHDLLQIHHFLDFHKDEGMLVFSLPSDKN